MYFEYIAERIFETLGGNVKFIFMLRNPMHRAYSHYLMNVNDGIENMSFETALKLEKDRISTNLYSKRYYSYQDRGYYGRQIAVFLKYFKRENMYFVVFENFIENKKEISMELFNFLNIDIFLDINFNIHQNKGQSLKYQGLNLFLRKNNIALKVVKKILPIKTKDNIKIILKKRTQIKNEINPKTKTKLQNNYYNDIMLTQELTGLDLSKWLV